MKEIDELDAKILRELLTDGRAGFTEIGKKFGTTKDVIWKHYNDMKKSGIIVGATIQFNYPLFGYEGIATLFLNAPSDNLEEVLAKLNERPDLYPSRIYNSQYNIAIISTIKYLKDLDNTKDALRHNPINSFKAYIWIDVKNIVENLDVGFPHYSINYSEKEKIAQENKAKNLVLNDVDMQIVEYLAEDSRQSFSSIGQLMGLSSDTVSRRYNRLVENNYIKSCVQINPVCLGYEGIAGFLISFSSMNYVKAAIEKLMQIPDVVHIIRVTGDYDLQLTVFIRTFGDLIEKNRKIQSISGISKMETWINRFNDYEPHKFPVPREFITTF